MQIKISNWKVKLPEHIWSCSRSHRLLNRSRLRVPDFQWFQSGVRSRMTLASSISIWRWSSILCYSIQITEFFRNGSSLLDKEHTEEKPFSAVIPENVLTIRKTWWYRFPYQMMQKDLNIGYAAICKIRHEELLINWLIKNYNYFDPIGPMIKQNTHTHIREEKKNVCQKLQKTCKAA